jgi:hypothetical protein
LEEREEEVDTDDTDAEEYGTPIWLPVTEILLALPNFTPLSV